MRINKLLARRGLCSRRKADELIEKGLVLVEGVPATLGQEVQKDAHIEVKGKKVLGQHAPTVLMLHKPEGYVTSSRRTKDAPHIVMDLIPKKPYRLFPIGRLDKESAGLLLFTSDGKLADMLLNPKYEKEKEYDVKLGSPLTQSRIEKLEKGVRLEGKETKGAKVLAKVGATRARIVLTEGKNRQIRKICGKVGAEVVSLKRVRMHTLTLGTLKKGASRTLTKEEVQALLRPEAQ